MERETSSSDEEEDCQHLVEHNEAKRPSHRSAFHIDDDCRSRIARRFSFSNNKSYYCLLAVFLPLFILIALFSTDIRNFFSSSTVSNAKIDPLRDGMREAELHALYLLRQQQLGLLTLWNRTFDDSVVRPPVLNSTEGNSSLNGFGIRKDESSLLSPLLFGDLKSAVLKQISLNREIRKVLLSPHSTGNSSEWDSGIGDHRLSDYGFNRCRNIDQKISKRRTIEWKPRSNKYLVAICVSGQMSNHLICLEKHMFFAALLDRILVLPSSKIDYQYNRVLDIDHVNKCVRRNVVITFEQFAEIKEKDMHIDRFICYFSQPQPCYVDEEHFKKLKSLGISVGKLEPAWIEDIKKPSKRTVQDVEAKFSVDDAVIAIGDVFYADVEKDWVMQPGGPLAHECKTLIEPSRLIMLTAQRFIQTFLGKKFIALHFRRHGFLKFCNAKEQSCFFPIPQAAECICRVAERAYAPVIYLSTDAAESETGLLQKLVIVDGKPIPLVKRPKRNSAEKWDAFLYRHGLEGDNQVEAMLDKTICALSSVFIGSSGSTFTEDILRLRKDWGTASLCDEYLCQGEQPNFIADEE